MDKLMGAWYNSLNISGVSYICGYCGKDVGPSKYYYNEYRGKISEIKAHIYICPNCNRPTYYEKSTKEQFPGKIIGDTLEHLPNDIEQLYNEARKCLSVNAYTSTVLSCRKLLMNISVSKGAEEGKQFAYYVTFLEENHFIPPGSRDWVDHIRRKGNEATHEIPSISRLDAEELLGFTEMLLRFVFELPGKMMTKYNPD